MADEDIRWKQRYANFDQALASLRQGRAILLTDPDNILMQAGIIQMFEFTFELAWKVLKDYLTSEGFQVASPKGAIRQGLQSGYIRQGDAWMQALESRNLTTHTYDCLYSQEVTKDILAIYIPLLETFADDFRLKL